jgi:hypothetical protein
VDSLFDAPDDPVQKAPPMLIHRCGCLGHYLLHGGHLRFVRPKRLQFLARGFVFPSLSPIAPAPSGVPPFPPHSPHLRLVTNPPVGSSPYAPRQGASRTPRGVHTPSQTQIPFHNQNENENGNGNENENKDEKESQKRKATTKTKSIKQKQNKYEKSTKDRRQTRRRQEEPFHIPDCVV